MNIRGCVVCVALGLAVAGCGSLPMTVAPTETVQSDQDAYFIIGVEPENAAVQIVRGSKDGSTFSENILSFVVFSGYPDNGFIIGKAKKGDLLGLGQIFMAKQKHSFWGRPYLACSGSNEPLFPVTGGKVTYFGDLKFLTNNKGELSLRYKTSSLDEVRAYLVAHYPALAERLEQAPPDLARNGSWFSCGDPDQSSAQSPAPTIGPSSVSTVPAPSPPAQNPPPEQKKAGGYSYIPAP